MTPDIIGDALIRAFAEQGYQATMESPTTVGVVLPEGSSGPLDISDWRAFAGRNSRADLPESAAAFVRGFVRKIEERKAQAATGATGAERVAEHSDVGSMLSTETFRVRLYTEEALGDPPHMRDALLTRPLAPGLLQTVVADYPDSIMPVNRSSLGGTPENQVFGEALRVSIEKEPHYVQERDFEDVPFKIIGETHRYVGARIHVLKRHVGAVPYGALVAFPLPEYIFLHEIGESHIIAAMETMQGLAAKFFETGEKALTPQVYWWRPGAYEALPEHEALFSGQVPDLRPVGIKIDHAEKSIAAMTADTNALLDLWQPNTG